MKKNLLLLPILGVFFSCQDKAQNLSNKSSPIAKPLTGIESLEKTRKQDSLQNAEKIFIQNETYFGGEPWLKQAIEEEFNQGIGNLENLCTKRYAEFKIDAMNIDFDGLTQSEFNTKWKGQFNLDRVSKGGFLLGSQDYGKITVLSILPKNVENNGAWYKVTIKDLEFNNTVKREIRIVKNGEKYLIDEVLESKAYPNY